MGTFDIGNASASDLQNQVTDYSVAPIQTDGATESKETEFMIVDFNKWLGYYKSIPELRIAIDTKATWTVGKGLTSDPGTETTLSFITGFGVDTINTVLENMIRTYYIGGDAFAQIVRNDEGDVINLKPLDPSVMKIIANKKGVIIRYEQMSKTDSKKAEKKFDTTDIFHLARNRVADEIHGISIVEALESIILMRNEAMHDYKQVMHRYMKPRYIFHLDTDDTTKIATFKTAMDKAWSDGENMYIPKDAVVPEQMAVSPNATLNPQQWIESLNDYFFEACSTPKIMIGNSKNFTDAASKISYLAFQQNVEEEQLFVEEQFLLQVGLRIKLTFPKTIENELISDEKKDGAVNIDPAETQVNPAEETNNDKTETEQN